MKWLVTLIARYEVTDDNNKEEQYHPGNSPHGDRGLSIPPSCTLNLAKSPGAPACSYE